MNNLNITLLLILLLILLLDTISFMTLRAIKNKNIVLYGSPKEV